MLSLTFIVLFVFCAAIAVASILLARQFITTYNSEFHRNYFYYLVTFFAFAFYGFWAPILMRVFLPSLELENELVAMIIYFLPILGMPFLLISWIMLVKMGYSLVAVQRGNRALPIYLVFLFFVMAVVLGIYFLMDTKKWFIGNLFIVAEITVFIVLELGYMMVFATIVWQYSKKQIPSHKKILIRFVLLMLLALMTRLGVLPFVFDAPWILAALILLYFISNFVPLFYLKLQADLLFAPLFAENPNEGKKEFMYRKYLISKREKEIVEQICLGKSNQQIADELFISLQTVKDHTHRIYTKIGINSRMKLVQLING